MSLNANKVPSSGASTAFPIMEAGSYPARLAQIIDLGLQPQSYKGEVKPPKNELMLTYELVDEFGIDEDGNEMRDKPRWQSERMSLNNLGSELAKSTKRYFALDPNEEEGGDFAKLGGLPVIVTLNVTKDGKYNNVSAVTPMRNKEASDLTELQNEAKVFVLDDPDMTIYKSLPEWVQKIILSNLDFDGSKLDELLGSDAPKEKNKGADEW